MKFQPGQIVSTQGARELFEAHPNLAMQIMMRHVAGDWGEVDAHDRKANDDTVKHGGRIFSAYAAPTGGRLWCITEADRSSTCILLPDEY